MGCKIENRPQLGPECARWAENARGAPQRACAAVPQHMEGSLQVWGEQGEAQGPKSAKVGGGQSAKMATGPHCGACNSAGTGRTTLPMRALAPQGQRAPDACPCVHVCAVKRKRGVAVRGCGADAVCEGWWASWDWAPRGFQTGLPACSKCTCAVQGCCKGLRGRIITAAAASSSA